MNWDYIAGIIDGEGCIGLYISDYGLLNLNYAVRITPVIQIACFSPELAIMGDFLKKSTNNHINLQLSKHRIAVADWKSIRILCEKLDGKLYIKRRELEVMKRAVDLYFSLPVVGNGRKISLKRNEFVKLAIELQGFKSNKGVKTDYSRFLK